MKARKKAAFRKPARSKRLAGNLIAAAGLALVMAFTPLAALAADLAVYGSGGGGGGQNGGGGAGGVIDYGGSIYAGAGGQGGGMIGAFGMGGSGFSSLPFVVTGGMGGDGADTVTNGQNGHLLAIEAAAHLSLGDIVLRAGQGGYVTRSMGMGKGGDSGFGYVGGSGSWSLSNTVPGLGGDVSFKAKELYVSGDIDVISGASAQSSALPAGNVSFSVETLEAVGAAAQNFAFYNLRISDSEVADHHPQTMVNIDNLVLRNDLAIYFDNVMPGDDIRVGNLEFEAGRTMVFGHGFDLTDPGSPANFRLGGHLTVNGPAAVLDMRDSGLDWDSRRSTLLFNDLHPALAGQTMLTYHGGGGSLLLEGSEVVIKPRSANEVFTDGQRLSLISGQLDPGSGLVETRIRSWAGATYFDFDLFLDDHTLEAVYVDPNSNCPDPGPDPSDPRSYGHGLEAATMFARARGEAVADTLVNSLPRTVGPFAFASLSGGHLKGGPGRKMTVDSGFMAAGLGYGFAGDGVYSAVGAFFDYGFGNWRAHNQTAEALHTPKGDLASYGGGVIGRMDFNPLGLRLDVSLAYGRLNSDLWATSDLLDHAASYDHRSNYWNAHLALRKLFALTKNHGVELNTAGLFAWQDSDSFNTSYDERVHAASVNSVRTRLGARYIITTDSDQDAGNWRFYVGGAWEKEYEGQNKLKIDGHKVAYNNALKGDTGLGEIGLKWRNAGFQIDLSASGRVGDTRGYGGAASIGIFF